MLACFATQRNPHNPNRTFPFLTQFHAKRTRNAHNTHTKIQTTMASLSTKNRLYVRAATQLATQSTVRLFGGHNSTLCATSSASNHSSIIVPQKSSQEQQQQNTCNQSLQQHQRRNYATNPIGLLQASNNATHTGLGSRNGNGIGNTRASRFFDGFHCSNNSGRMQVSSNVVQIRIYSKILQLRCNEVEHSSNIRIYSIYRYVT